jgi:flagellar basal-body rod protein FlgC
MFNAITTAGTGLQTYQLWIDALGNNIANVNTITPTSGNAFQAQFVEAQALPAGQDGVGGGVRATGLPGSDPNGIVTYDPGNPLADGQGYVRRPDIDLSEQMGNLIMAQRAYQANATVVDRATSVYEAGIAIGAKVR